MAKLLTCSGDDRYFHAINFIRKEMRKHMKKKIATCIILTSIVTGGEIPLNVFANPVAHAESIQEEVDISSSLRKLGARSVLIQSSIDQALKRPNVNLIEIPALNSNQEDVKREMQEWSNELYPNVIQLHSRSKAFIYKLDSYYPQLKNFVDNETDKQGFLDRLAALQTAVTSNQSKIQSYINEVEGFKLQLSDRISKLDENVEKGQTLLGTNGKIDKLQKAITAAQASIDKDLQEIALVPEALNEAGFRLFKDIYKTAKDIIDPVADSAMAAINKGQEIEKSIVDAEKEAEKAAKEDGKSEQEIAEMKKAVREKMEKDKKSELAAAAEAKMKEYDLTKAIDLDRIEQMYKEFGKMNTLTVEQQNCLNDLLVQNQKIYEMTKNLKIADLQKASMLLMKNDLHNFAENIDTELVLMSKYKKDWNLISDSIKQLSADTTETTSLFPRLKRLKDLRNQLEQQVDKFNLN